MLSFLPTPLIVFLSYVLFISNLIFWCAGLFYPVLLFKIILSPTPLRKYPDWLLTKIGEGWIKGNNAVMWLMLDLEWDVDMAKDLSRDESYLLTSNHQSWVDIVVLQKLFGGHAPFPRFFIKQELIWVPLLGLAWWGLDFPFMKRFSREYLEKHPEMKGKDLEATRRSCEHFKKHPVSIINFFEGTRFTKAKHERQQSPFTYLLKPKAGGAAFTLSAMDGAIKKLVDVTIVYPTGKKQFKDLFANRVGKIVVKVNSIEIPREFLHGDYENDPEFRANFQAWINDIWVAKDQLIDSLLPEPAEAESSAEVAA